MLHACDEDENRKNDHENGSHWHDFDVFVVTEREQAICVLFPEKFAEDYLRQTRRTKDEMGRQHQGMDRLGVRQVPEGSGEQGKMEKSGCKISCGAPTTLAVKGLMMMMMMMMMTCDRPRRQEIIQKYPKPKSVPSLHTQ